MSGVGNRHRKGSLDAEGRKIALRRKEEEEARALEVVDVAEAVVPEEAGSVPLKDKRRERYCQLVTQGGDPVESWWIAFNDEEGLRRTSRGQALTQRARISKCADVEARVAWLGKQQLAASKISKGEKVSMLDALLKKTFEKAMRENASANDVKAFLDVSARHDVSTGMGGRPRIEIVFPQMDALFSAQSQAEVEKKLGVKKP